MRKQHQRVLGQVVPTILPNAKMWDVKRGRLLLGVVGTCDVLQTYKPTDYNVPDSNRTSDLTLT